jgi:hypothetical protein
MAAAEEKPKLVQKQFVCPTCLVHKDPSEYSKRSAMCKPCSAMWSSIYRHSKKHDHMHFYQDARYRHFSRGHEVWRYVQLLKKDLDEGERRKTPMFMIDEFYQACGWEEPLRFLAGRDEPLPQPQLQQVPEPESQPSSNSSSSRADTPELSSQSSSTACTPEKKRKTKSEMDTVEVDAIGDDE